MKKIILGAVCASLLTINADADFLGVEAGYALWNPAVTGTIQNGSDLVDVEKDLGFGEKETNSFMWAYLDHPLPLIPNIKIQQTKYSDKSSGTLSKNFTFAKKDFVISEATTSELTLNQTDIILYWRLLDNWVNLDVGIETKGIKGNIKIDSQTKHIDEDFSLVVPLAYAKVRFDLPFTGLSVEADIATVSYSGNSFTDTKAAIVYETSIGLGALAGYRNETLKLDDIDDTDADITISGMYAGVFFHF
jgi:outer membrane protein